jgi:hypothetical protein
VHDPRLQKTKSSNLGTSLDKLLGKNEINSPIIQAIEVVCAQTFENLLSFRLRHVIC